MLGMNVGISLGSQVAINSWWGSTQNHTKKKNNFLLLENPYFKLALW